MKFTLPTAAFAEAAAHASSVVPSKSPKPVFQCLAIRAEKQGILVEATDLDVFVRIRIPDAKVSEEGSVAVHAARLVAVLHEVAEKEVTIESADGGVEIDTANSHFRIHGADLADFPVLPDFPQARALTLPCGVLRAMIRRTQFATATEPGRFALHGVQMRYADGTLEFVATDGRRLAKAVHKVAAGAKSPGAVPGEAVPEVKAILGVKGLALLDRVAGDDAGSVDVALQERQVLWRTGNVVVGARLVDGAFPTYEDVIPKPSKRGVSLPAGDLLGALRRASIVTSRETNSVSLEFAPQNLTISARTVDVGEAQVNLKVAYADAAEKLGFNPAFLLDALKVMDPARPVRFEFTGPKAPGKLTDGEDYVYVVMPVQAT